MTYKEDEPVWVKLGKERLSGIVLKVHQFDFGKVYSIEIPDIKGIIFVEVLGELVSPRESEGE